jgi:hypothetical protein
MSVSCPACGKQLKNKLALASHMRAHKSTTTGNTTANNSTARDPHITINTDVELQVLQMLDDGHSPIEIMQIHKLDVPTMRAILQDYRELASLMRPEKTAAEGMLQIARLFGEHIRDGCSSFDDEQGICTEYALYDIDEEFRRSFPGLFKGAGGKTRFHVGNNPWICVFCRKGVKRE